MMVRRTFGWMMVAYVGAIALCGCTEGIEKSLGPVDRGPEIAAKLARMNGRRLKVRVSKKHKDGSLSLVRVSYIAISSNGIRLDFTPIQGAASLMDDELPCVEDCGNGEPDWDSPTIVNAWADLYTHNATMPTPTARTDIDATQLAFNAFAIDTSD